MKGARLWALMRRSAGTAVDWRDLTRRDQARAVRDLLAGPCPETVFLFAGLGPEARRAFEVFSDEARAWRSMAEMEAARGRVWSRQGRVWDAGLCVGRAQAYRAAAQQVEDVLIESLDLWGQYERQAGENGR
ncbi:hypothetical protein ACFOY4_27675 [Actinomadura syzygii]|uniref:Uncharacterized protein n=1 Tax=Actinomadura syzygii TaxID=1427538 RepID=A0A5D0UG90_9ACTN|nr:hypothetical protein [Actinomadura syzygii]TYC17408.1 hypothetical protein FXF65_05185 [Actinomadura syzygii]